MKPRLTKEMVSSLQQRTQLAGDQSLVSYEPELILALCHYARIALHLEDYHHELFRMIEKILEKK